MPRSETDKKVNSYWWTPDFRMGAYHWKSIVDQAAELPHTHADYAFIFCLAGQMEFVCSGRYHLLEPSNVLVHHPGEIHQSRYGRPEAPSDGISLVLDEFTVESILERMHLSYRAPLDRLTFPDKADAARVAQLLQDLIHELFDPRIGYDLVVESLLVQILVHLFRYCLEPVATKPRPKLPPQLATWHAIRAMEYIGAHGKANFNVTKLCSEIGISPSSFIPLFKNSTGLCPHTYFNRILLRKACRLLRSAKYSVKEVAGELGFQNPSHFCKFFRAGTGITTKSFQVLDDPSIYASLGFPERL